MLIDLRQMAFATLWKKYEKKINTNETKEAIRNGDAVFKFADYCSLVTKDYTTSKYSEEDQAKIDKFIEENGIKKITETKKDYSLEFVPSEKAIKEFDKMLDKLEDAQLNGLADTVDRAMGAIDDYKQALYGGKDTTEEVKHMEYEINVLRIKLDKLETTQPKNIAKVASKVKSTI